MLRLMQSNLKNIIHSLFKSRRGKICVGCLLVFYLLSGLAPFIAPYEISDQDLKKTYHPPTLLIWKDGALQVQKYRLVDRSAAQYEAIEGESTPLRWFTVHEKPRQWMGIDFYWRLFSVDSGEKIYLLGSDHVGRDLFSRLLYGARVSLWIGVMGVLLSIVPGFWIGSIAGYFGGKIDSLLMRVCEMLMMIPGLYLLLALRAALGSRFPSDQMFFLIVAILSLIGWSGYARVFRGLALSIRQRPYVIAAEALGQSPWKIIHRHFVPNMFSYAIVAGTMGIPGYILGEAALSFLGVGIQEPMASWGLLLSQAQDMKVFMLNLWWLLIPGIAIFMVVILFNVLGDLLRDAVDPHFRMIGGKSR